MFLASAARSLFEPENKQSAYSRIPGVHYITVLTIIPVTDISTSDWSKPAEILVRALSLHLERINQTLSRYIGLQDIGGCISIQGSNVIALVALAEIYHHLARNPMFRQITEAQDRCFTAMEHVVATVKDLRNGNHFQKVHVYTGVSQEVHLIECNETYDVYLFSSPYAWR